MAIKNYTSGVDVFTSLGEIQGALAGHGARQIMVEYDEKGRPTGVTFSIDTPTGRRGFMLGQHRRRFVRIQAAEAQGRP